MVAQTVLANTEFQPQLEIKNNSHQQINVVTKMSGHHSSTSILNSDESIRIASPQNLERVDLSPVKAPFNRISVYRQVKSYVENGKQFHMDVKLGVLAAPLAAGLRHLQPTFTMIPSVSSPTSMYLIDINAPAATNHEPIRFSAV